MAIPTDQVRARDTRSGPTAEGFFLDVPFVLDSLFRWSEYRANRVGHVEVADAAAPPMWVNDRPWRSPAFALYIAVSVFLVFGPTFDSLCGLVGPLGIKTLAQGAATFTLVGIVIFCAWQLLRIVQRLTRRLRGSTDYFNQGATVDLGRWARQMRDVTRSILRRDVLSSDWQSKLERWLSWLPDLRVSVRRLNARGWWRLIVAGVVLTLIAIGAAAPLWLVYVALSTVKPVAAVCSAHTNESLVAAQLLILTFWIGAGGWIWSTTRLRTPLQRLSLLAGLWAIGVALLWTLLSPKAARELTPGPYPHVYGVLVATLMLFVGFAYWLAQRLFGFPRRVWYREYRDAPSSRRVRVSWRDLFRRRLAVVELIDLERSDPQLSPTRIVGALVNGIGRQPLQFLLLPAFIALLWTPENLFSATAVAAVLGAILLAYGSLAERWQQLITYINRWYFIGVPLPLSLLVIVLGLLRLANVQYVSTVLDAAPLGTLAVIVIMAYAAAWFYEYWINRWPADRLLDALAGLEHRRQGSIPIRFSGPIDPNGAKASPRYLSVHGTGRFCVQGWFERAQPALWEKPRDAAFSTYSLMELFEALAPPGDGMARRALSSLRRRLRLYFYTLNGLLVLVLGALWYWHLSLATPERSAPVIAASLEAPPVATALPLSQRFARQAARQRPVIVVAASGGGTRAALYTAHALQGLARLDRAQDVVLISGVSGGGFASAVFAANATTLQRAIARSQPAWRAARVAMTQPFIADVVDGVGELRILNTTPLGQLLAESFTARTFAGRRPTLGSLTGPALILNTTISGHPADESQLLDQRASVTTDGSACATLASLAGGRLVFTNLPMERIRNDQGQWGDHDPFPSDLSELPDVRLDYTVVRDPGVSLAAAAALNANFPPVFPNAKVSLRGGGHRCAERSFFVTDGGATENLGLVSALYAVQGALRAWPLDQPLPPLHLVAVEASAVSYDYSQDRGLGAATGGSKERINGALTDLLLADIRARVERLGGPLHVHYLPLPVAFRSRGGFGTHWMYAKTFRVTNPFVRDVPNRFMAPIRSRLDEFRYYETISQRDLAALWNGLFRADAGFCDSTVYAQDLKALTRKAQQVRAWICGEVTLDDAAARQAIGGALAPDSAKARLLTTPKRADYLVSAWGELVRTLGTPRHTGATRMPDTAP